jgi:hypothetical protein
MDGSATASKATSDLPSVITAPCGDEVAIVDTAPFASSSFTGETSTFMESAAAPVVLNKISNANPVARLMAPSARWIRLEQLQNSGQRHGGQWSPRTFETRLSY